MRENDSRVCLEEQTSKSHRIKYRWDVRTWEEVTNSSYQIQMSLWWLLWKQSREKNQPYKQRVTNKQINKQTNKHYYLHVTVAGPLQAPKTSLSCREGRYIRIYQYCDWLWCYQSTNKQTFWLNLPNICLFVHWSSRTNHIAHIINIPFYSYCDPLATRGWF
jgi:hypothetical protein